MNIQTDSDMILVERCQRGEMYAMDELFEKYQKRAFLYALRLTKHVDEASDVVSEGFNRIHRAIGRFQATASFTTWMFKILKNCFLDIRKKRRVNVVASLDECYESEHGVSSFQPIDHSESAFELVSRNQFNERVMSAVDQLPLHQRHLILMHYSDQLSYDSMSKVLEIPAGTIKSRLHRAKSNLKAIIQRNPSFGSLANSI